MMVLNFVLCFDFLHRSNCWSVHFSAIFAGAALLQVYYILNLSASIVGASAAIMGILVAVTTYQPLMNVRLLLIGNIKYGILQL
jgi:membrane associated rhomboid family serine protease